MRHIKLRLGEGAELIKALENNGQVLRRYMDGTVKVLPADLEDAWVLALPEPYRGDCERDLARRRGYMATPMPSTATTAQVANCGKFLAEAGQLCEALAPALADGVLCAKDMPHARRIINEVDDVIAAVTTIRHQVQKLMPGGSGD